jgi:Spaetzle
MRNLFARPRWTFWTIFWGRKCEMFQLWLQRMTMHLKSALNTDKEFRFIINSVEYSQKVMTETCTWVTFESRIKLNSISNWQCVDCRGESKPCSHVTSPIGSETVCRQKYVEVYLLAVNEVGKPVMDTFRIPSSCVCYSKLSPNARSAARSLRSSWTFACRVFVDR